jgi:3-oxoacyl-[acyl-carrier protein] reductase
MNTNTQKTALVTGASRGMGRATALALGRANIRVFVHYGQSEAEASSAVQEIRAVGGQAEKVQADLETADGPIDLAKRVRELAQGGLDFLVANAGVSKGLPFDAYKIEDFDRLYAINVRAPFFLVQQALPFINEGAEDAIRAAGLVQCKEAMGVHYDTFPPIKIDHAAAKETFRSKGLALHLLPIGGSQDF